MANQMMCKGCEDSEEPEYGIYLISDLQNIGVLPFAIGRNCLPEWLAFMMETYGMPAVEEVMLEPSESDEEPPDEPQTLEEAQALLRAENAPRTSRAILSALHRSEEVWPFTARVIGPNWSKRRQYRRTAD